MLSDYIINIILHIKTALLDKINIHISKICFKIFQINLKLLNSMLLFKF